MGRQWLYQRLSALRYSWEEGGGVNIAPETLTILNFFQRWWKAFFFTHLDISFDVWGNRVIFVNFWLSKVNLQLPDKRPRIKSASPWEPFLSLLAFSCLLFKGRTVPLYQRTRTQPWCFPSSSHSHCLKLFSLDHYSWNHVLAPHQSFSVTRSN